jgi:hypothetical protein
MSRKKWTLEDALKDALKPKSRIKHKRPALNRYWKRGDYGMVHPHFWFKYIHRHKFRMKRMKRTPRLTKHKTGICP